MPSLQRGIGVTFAILCWLFIVLLADDISTLCRANAGSEEVSPLCTAGRDTVTDSQVV